MPVGKCCSLPSARGAHRHASGGHIRIFRVRWGQGCTLAGPSGPGCHWELLCHWKWPPLGRGGLAGEEKRGPGQPSLFLPHTVSEQRGPPSIRHAARGVTSVASWGSCHGSSRQDAHRLEWVASPGNPWYPEPFVGILLESCCYIFPRPSWQGCPQQREAGFDLSLLLARSLPGWRRGLSLLASAPAQGPFLEGGPRIVRAEALLVPLPWPFNVAGGYTVVGQDLAKWSVSEKTCSLPVFNASLNLTTSVFLGVSALSAGCTKPKHHVGLSTALGQKSEAVKCLGRVQKRPFHCLLLLLVKLAALHPSLKQLRTPTFWQVDNGRGCRLSTLTWLGIWPDATVTPLSPLPFRINLSGLCLCWSCL